MKYKDLRDFIAMLEQQGKLKRVAHPVSPHLETGCAMRLSLPCCSSKAMKSRRSLYFMFYPCLEAV